jgi:hypothetical protein
MVDPLDRTVSESTAVGTGAAKTTTFSHLGLSDQGAERGTA